MADEKPTDHTRPYHALDDPIIYPVVALGVAVTTAFPIFLGQRFCLPLLNALVIFPLFAWAVRLGKPRRALSLALFWLVCQSLATVAASLLLSDQASSAILRGLEHRSQMLAWIASGQGGESSLALFLPRQLRDLAIFALASLFSGGLGGLILGAAALNATSFYVAGLIQQSSNWLLLALTAWPIWSIVRAAGYLICGIVLAEPVAVLDLRPAWWSAWWRRRRRLLAAGLGLILLGIALQALLAPLWADWLRQATGLT